MYKSILRSFSLLTVWYCNFLPKEYWSKSCAQNDVEIDPWRRKNAEENFCCNLVIFAKRKRSLKGGVKNGSLFGRIYLLMSTFAKKAASSKKTETVTNGNFFASLHFLSWRQSYKINWVLKNTMLYKFAWFPQVLNKKIHAWFCSRLRKSCVCFFIKHLRKSCKFIQQQYIRHTFINSVSFFNLDWYILLLLSKLK